MYAYVEAAVRCECWCASSYASQTLPVAEEAVEADAVVVGVGGEDLDAVDLDGVVAAEAGGEAEEVLQRVDLSGKDLSLRKCCRSSLIGLYGGVCAPSRMMVYLSSSTLSPDYQITLRLSRE